MNIINNTYQAVSNDPREGYARQEENESSFPATYIFPGYSHSFAKTDLGQLFVKLCC